MPSLNGPGDAVLRRLLPIGTAALLAGAGLCQAHAAPNCMARIIKDVPADEAPEEIKSKSNGEFGPIVRVKVSKSTGRMSYCAHQSYCYNSNSFVLSAPCRLKLDKEQSGPSFFVYSAR